MPQFNGVPPRRKDEKDFEREARSEYLLPLLTLLAQQLGAESPDASVRTLVRAVDIAIQDFIRNGGNDALLPIAENWAGRLDAYHQNRFVRDFVRVTKVDVRPAMTSQAFEPLIRDRIRESVALIERIPDHVRASLVQGFTLGELDAPMDLAARERMIREQWRKTTRAAGYNIRRVTRDQSNKLTGELTRLRQEAVGVRSYMWRTSQDDRVRANHASKNGQVFQWGMPPPDTGHPGDDIQCRCVAIAQISVDDIKQRFGVS